jgi:hypothetical protein
MSKYYSPSRGGFVDREILGEAFPADAIEIDDAQYHSLLSGQMGGGVAHVGTSVALVDPTASASLDDLKSRKRAEINAAFAASIADLKANYPADEIQSWFKQEAEARAYEADNNASTPLLSAMANARGITVADLAARVVTNADAYSVAAGALIGKRQKYEDSIEAATDADTVSVIAWA